MRISDNARVNDMMTSINLRQMKMFNLQEQISSLKRVLRPSDDPFSAHQIIGERARIGDLERYRNNVTVGLSRMKMTSSQLYSVEEILMEAADIAQSMASGVATYSAESESGAEQINVLLADLLNAANSKFGGKYLFGGKETLTAPFTANMSGSMITSVIPNPNGIDGKIYTVVGEGQTVQINVPGDTVFQPNGSGGVGDVFDHLIDLRDALQANDSAQITAQMEKIQEDLNNVISEESSLGTRINNLESKDKYLEDTWMGEKENLSVLEDLDLAEALMDLAVEETALEAALKTASDMFNQSLFNYI